MIFLKNNTPRWIVFLLDLLICTFSIISAYYLRFNFEIPENEVVSLVFIVPLVLFIRALTFIIFRSYAGIIRYTSAKDTERIFIVAFTGSLAFFIIDLFTFYYISNTYLIPRAIIIIDFLITVFIMTSSRLFIKTLYLEINHPSRLKKNVIIYGSGQFAAITKRTLDRDMQSNNKVAAFIDHTKKNVRNKLEGITIYPYQELNRLLDKYKVEKLIIAKEQVSPKRKNELTDICLKKNIKILSIPKIESWINGELSFNQIKEIKIEDLLERDPIILDKKSIKTSILNKTVLVTGAAGSIGSEIVRQVCRFSPKKIILFDQAESPLYDLELELKEKFNIDNFDIVIGDMTNKNRLNFTFKKFAPDIIYHAAAYKHVPMMESNPGEAILTNVMGTKFLADLSINYGVDRFVMISTDKAVNPTNIMGASKRIAEIYIQSLNPHSLTKFITTRFGNVLGSNGSVIPRFKKQIEQGGPVTITHPDVTRYFMTIPEACQLVLEAGAMGKGGEIFIFDMGQSVKIIDLAQKMIKLSGLTLGRDIQIKFTGLRPGEKLYEELLNNKEDTLTTHHSQIMIAKVSEHDLHEVEKQIIEIIGMAKTYDNLSIAKLMKNIVPEFVSKNSIYEELDVQKTTINNPK